MKIIDRTSTLLLSLLTSAMLTSSLTACDGGSSSPAPNEGQPDSAPEPTGTPIHVEDQSTLSLELTIVQHNGKPALQLAYEGQPLSQHRHAIEHQMRELTEYDIQIPDFDHEGKHYRVSVMSVKADGSLEPWARGGPGCRSPKITRPERETVHVPFVVVAVREDGKQILSDPYPETITPPMNPPLDAPPPQRTTMDQGTGDGSSADDTSGG